MVEIKTERLLLLPWSDDYLDDFVRLFSDPEVRRYTTPGGRPLSREECVSESDHMRLLWDQYGYGMWAAIDKGSGRWIGWVGLNFLKDFPGEHKCEVGWVLDPAFWGQGFATEGGKASVRFGFEEAKLERIISLTHPQNMASRRVMEKCGLVDQGLTQYLGFDVVWYAIDRAGWRPPATPN